MSQGRFSFNLSCLHTQSSCTLHRITLKSSTIWYLIWCAYLPCFCEFKNGRFIKLVIDGGCVTSYPSNWCNCFLILISASVRIFAGICRDVPGRLWARTGSRKVTFPPHVRTWTAQLPCGSSCCSFCWIPAMTSSSAGPMRMESSNCCRQKRWPDYGVPARTNPAWTTTNSAGLCVTTMTRCVLSATIWITSAACSVSVTQPRDGPNRYDLLYWSFGECISCGWGLSHCQNTIIKLSIRLVCCITSLLKLFGSFLWRAYLLFCQFS